ncbi:unnamed protein product [Moneuplotes crassus]|uniref:Uncharacterized protein n=1 Tax=Euplotes crassus TaxID=5936 RepID=A0AAD1XWS3_EUPCR|nr:unnamed protein product [Moneuplotes crassus]
MKEASKIPKMPFEQIRLTICKKSCEINELDTHEGCHVIMPKGLGRKRNSITDLNKTFEGKPPKLGIFRGSSVPLDYSKIILKNSKMKLFTEGDDDELSSCAPNLRIMIRNSEIISYYKKGSKLMGNDPEKTPEATPTFSLDSPHYWNR